MGKYTALNNQLKSEIDSILVKFSLIELINSYGKVLVTGSYTYDLMAWRDYDLVLQLNNYNMSEVYALVEEIGIKLNPDKLRILNNLKKIESNRPEGVWLGVYVENWKLDIWLMNSQNYEIEVQRTKEMQTKLKSVDREILISIKAILSEDPDYHVKFSSVDLYEAYLEGGVKTVKEFYQWDKEKRVKNSEFRIHNSE